MIHPEKDIFTVEEAAAVLKLHPRTVARFIREGRMEAVKVGREWRIHSGEIRKILGDSAEDVKYSPVRTASFSDDRVDEIRASSVVDVPVRDREEARQLIRTVSAALMSKDPENGNSRCESLYDELDKRVRFLIWGGPVFMKNFFSVIDMLQKEKT